MSDDHAAHAMSCYGSRINKTPNLDRIAADGMLFSNCFCTNSICTPSRATILAGTYNHVNAVTTLDTMMDNRLVTFPKLLRASGYQTAVFGKWHLGQGEAHQPAGFDRWCVLPGQGLYHDPEMIEMGKEQVFHGYVTDLVTDLCIDWVKQRDRTRPFCLLYHHKAPHRRWEPDSKHARLYADTDIPEPDTFADDYSHRARAAGLANMRVDRDLDETDLKQPVPDGLDPAQAKRWKYQRYIKDYLRCVASVDDNVGRFLDFLDSQDLSENTIVIYTSDQGFFLGDHGWYDKRFMYEESLRMPFVIRYPQEIKPGSVRDDMILNVDFAQTLLDYAGLSAPAHMQGRSFRPLLNGTTPDDWQTAMYYRYWMHADGCHNVCAHYGVRTRRHKLIYYYADPCGQPGAIEDPREPEWELFDLQQDGCEMRNVYREPDYADTVTSLTAELAALQRAVGDKPYAAE
jgi:arylsulfatase A-like enzyme